MNPNLCRIELRRRDSLEVLDLTLRFLRERWAPLARLAMVVVFPVWLAASAACWISAGSPAVLVLLLPVLPALRAPFTLAAGRLMFSDGVSLREVFSGLASRAWPLVGAWMLLALGFVASALTLFYVLVFVQAGQLYLTEAVLLERVDARRAFRRSLRLAGGHLGLSLAGAFGGWALLLWGMLVGEAFGQAAVHFVLQVPPVFGSLLEGSVTPYAVAGVLAVQPLHALYRLLLYVDVRTRIEGWDLQVALRAAGLAATRRGSEA